MSVGVIHRIRYRRKGWSGSRLKDVIVPSRRGAMGQAAKLYRATRHYGLSEIEELYIEEGSVHWGARVPFEPPEQSSPAAPVERVAGSFAEDE
jgi:hypothetical protein